MPRAISEYSDLQVGDRMHGVRPADGFRADFGYA